MRLILKTLIFGFVLSLVCSSVYADEYSDTKKMFQDAGIIDMFNSAYGYALFPTIGKAGFLVGGAYGEGRVYEQGKHIGNTNMIQATVGFQLGATGFSQVVFLQDKRTLTEFTNGNFEFGAEAQATAITASVSASANTAGNYATASAGKNNASTVGGGYQKGMATFTITKGGLMYEATVGGQKFSFTKL
jgi:lipid-binding SYLF domain-containing protein